MSLRPIQWVLLCAVTLSALGCKDEEKCTKARSDAADAWKALTELAGKNKLAPVMGIDDMPADKKAAHVDAWSTIEKGADLIASAFNYAEITWSSADPARKKVDAAFDGYFAKEKFRTFETQLKDADAKFDATSAACRN